MDLLERREEGGRLELAVDEECDECQRQESSSWLAMPSGRGWTLNGSSFDTFSSQTIESGCGLGSTVRRTRTTRRHHHQHHPPQTSPRPLLGHSAGRRSHSPPLFFLVPPTKRSAWPAGFLFLVMLLDSVIFLSASPDKSLFYGCLTVLLAGWF